MLRSYEEMHRLHGIYSPSREKRLPCVGHILEAHARVSFAISRQVVPLFAGGGLVHDRLRC